MSTLREDRESFFSDFEMKSNSVYSAYWTRDKVISRSFQLQYYTFCIFTEQGGFMYRFQDENLDGKKITSFPLTSN